MTRLRAKTRPCACGCGRAIPDRTVHGQSQRFAHGHNSRKPLETMYRVEDRGYETPCWIWQGALTVGHGRVRWNGRMECAHRVFYEESGRKIPTGHQLDHLCRIRACVNPDHLEPVVAAENVQRGARTTLRPGDVEEIRRARTEALATASPKRDGTPRRRVPNGRAIRAELAKRYGVTPDQIKHIWGGRSWAN